jgi:hypothetical protein
MLRSMRFVVTDMRINFYNSHDCLTCTCRRFEPDAGQWRFCALINMNSSLCSHPEYTCTGLDLIEVCELLFDGLRTGQIPYVYTRQDLVAQIRSVTCSP